MPLVVAAITIAGFVAVSGAPSGATGISVSGVVKDASGAVRPGVRVELRDDDGNSATTTSAANGSYALQVAPGSYQVLVVWDAFDQTFQGAFGSSATPLVVNANDTENITIPTTAAVNVHVVDSTNAPIANAHVFDSYGDQFNGTPLSGGTTMQFQASNTPEGDTDASGNFSLPALLGDPALPITVQPPAGLSVNTTVNVTTNPTPLTVQISPGISVSGVVKDASGAVRPGVRVELRDDDGNSATTTSAANGSYALQVAPGSYQVLVVWDAFDQTFQGAFGSSATPLVVNANDTENITIPTTAAVNVHVVDSTNAPIANAHVFDSYGDQFNGTPLSGGTTMQFQASNTPEGDTDASGNFSLPALLGDPALPITVQPPAGLSVNTTVNVTTNPTPLTVQISPGISVSGVVKDASGAVRPGVRVELRDDDGNSATTTSAANGSYALQVAPGSYQVLVVWDAFDQTFQGAFGSSATPLVVNANDTENITIPTTAAVNVHVVDSTNAPIANAHVFDSYGDQFNGTPLSGGTTMQFQASNTPEGDTDASGNFSLPALLGDPALPITVQPPAGLSVNTTVNVTTNPTSLAIGISYLNGATVTSVGSSSGAVTVSSPPGTHLFNVSQQQVAASSLPAGSVALIGALSYTVDGVSAGATVDVTLQLPANSHPTGVYKLQNGTYTDVSSIATINSDQITLHMTDGGTGDADGVANGEIIDPIVPFRKGAPATPAVGPGAPSKVLAIPGNGTVTLAWAAPLANNGAPIDAYQVVPYVKGVAGAAIAHNTSSLKQAVGGLKNGVTYTFKVAAHNVNGFGALSPASAPVTIGAPLAPTHLTATPKSGAAALQWTAPNANGSRVTGYRIDTRLGKTLVGRSQVGASTHATVSGLSNGKRYTFTVLPQNARGVGLGAATPAVVVGAPAAPTAVKVTRPARGAFTINFRVPAGNGARITTFTAGCTSSNGGAARSRSGKAAPIKITGLTPGKRYTCSVKATNSRGTGPASAASAAVTA